MNMQETFFSFLADTGSYVEWSGKKTFKESLEILSLFLFTLLKVGSFLSHFDDLRTWFPDRLHFNALKT